MVHCWITVESSNAPLGGITTRFLRVNLNMAKVKLFHSSWLSWVKKAVVDMGAWWYGGLEANGHQACPNKPVKLNPWLLRPQHHPRILQCYSSTKQCYSSTKQCYPRTKQCYSSTKQCYSSSRQHYSSTGQCYSSARWDWKCKWNYWPMLYSHWSGE